MLGRQRERRRLRETDQQGRFSRELELLVPALCEVGVWEFEEAALFAGRTAEWAPRPVLHEQEDLAHTVVTLTANEALLLEPGPVARDRRL